MRDKLITEEEEEDTPTLLPPFKSNTELRFEKLEQLIQSIPALDGQAHGHDIIDPGLREKLPKKVALGDLPKFKGAENPDDHLRVFSISMALKGMSKDLFAYVFPLTLDAHPSKWFRSLNRTKLNDWDYIKNDFRKQYICNTQLPISLRELGLTK